MLHEELNCALNPALRLRKADWKKCFEFPWKNYIACVFFSWKFFIPPRLIRLWISKANKGLQLGMEKKTAVNWNFSLRHERGGNHLNLDLLHPLNAKKNHSPQWGAEASNGNFNSQKSLKEIALSMNFVNKLLVLEQSRCRLQPSSEQSTVSRFIACNDRKRKLSNKTKRAESQAVSK